MNKYIYEKVLQEYEKEYGWSDLISYNQNDADDMRELRNDLRSYREEGICVRVISRRTLNKN